MGFAIGFALLHGQTTKPELFSRRITNGPPAGLFGQFHQADLLGGLFHLVDLAQGLWADLIGGRLRWQWLTGRNDLAARERHFGLGCGRRGFCARFLNFRDLGRGHFRRSLGLGRCLGLGVRFGGCGLAARLLRPRRWTLPMTALRVTPPSSLAIWLADWPSPHIFFNTSTRSSVQDILVPLIWPEVGYAPHVAYGVEKSFNSLF
jgi:hypothetical protein